MRQQVFLFCAMQSLRPLTTGFKDSEDFGIILLFRLIMAMERVMEIFSYSYQSTWCFPSWRASTETVKCFVSLIPLALIYPELLGCLEYCNFLNEFLFQSPSFMSLVLLCGSCELRAFLFSYFGSSCRLLCYIDKSSLFP